MKENIMGAEEIQNFISGKIPGAKMFFAAMRGSRAYGTALPSSDTDYAGVYIQSLDDILSNRYKEQINDDKNDFVFYEIRRFLELLETNNPTMLELLYSPSECVIFKHPVFDLVINERGKFLTKICRHSFGGYAVQQIKKAKGQNKKQNWEEEKIERKDILDFVYVLEKDESIPWKLWNLTKGNLEEKFCGVASVSHARDVYAVYYDYNAERCFSEKKTWEYRERWQKYLQSQNIPMSLGYRGMVKTDEKENKIESNELRLSSIPKGKKNICLVFFNKDAYTIHCKDYKSYKEWLEKKNPQRWVEVKNHGQKIDGKNMMHCRRLLNIALEIARGEGLKVKRDDAEELLKIRKGEINLEDLIRKSEKQIDELDLAFKNSALPEKVDPNLISDLLVEIRKRVYF